ncbi:MAG: transcriptional regulator [Candidatus Altiarchaeales archaeon ex4484_2]|nr:MAG: transcriptional regulator [Candidatus Altiarchaeales archaeon ex4484_2]
MVRFTDIDLLVLLIRNSRATNVELGKKLGVSETAVRKRIKKLENKGLVKKYTLEVDQKQLGYQLDTLLGIDTQPEKYTRILEGLKNKKHVIQLHSTSGEHTITARCWFRNTAHMAEFTRELEKKQGVLKVTPTIILERIK